MQYPLQRQVPDIDRRVQVSSDESDFPLPDGTARALAYQEAMLRSSVLEAMVSEFETAAVT